MGCSGGGLDSTLARSKLHPQSSPGWCRLLRRDSAHRSPLTLSFSVSQLLRWFFFNEVSDVGSNTAWQVFLQKVKFHMDRENMCIEMSWRDTAVENILYREKESWHKSFLCIPQNSQLCRHLDSSMKPPENCTIPFFKWPHQWWFIVVVISSVFSNCHTFEFKNCF